MTATAPRTGGPTKDEGAEPTQREDRVARVMALLRRRGGRATGPRRAVLMSLLAAGDEHRSAEELAREVHAGAPEIHPTTVYRTLETFETLGVAYHTHLGHGPAQWHLGDAPHGHLTCGGCGEVVHVPAGTLAPLVAALERELGFQIDFRHFALTGRCRGCSGLTPGGDDGD